MAEVVELRVHGVGGTPPQDLLGEPRPGGMVRVAGEGKSAFFARLRDGRRVEGYAWGALTSSGAVQPLWIFLLPFTLVNVAGWMLPPRSEARSTALWHAARWSIFSLGGLLTLDYLYGVSVIITRQILFEFGTREWGLAPETTILLGTGIVLILGVIVFMVALGTQRRFEAVRNPVPPPLEEQPPPPRSEGGGTAATAKPVEDKLGDPSFWASRKTVKSHLWVHLVLGAGALGWLTWRALSEIGKGSDQLSWRPAFLWAGIAQLSLLGLLVLVLLAGFRHPVKWFITGHFRILGPFVANTTAIGLAGGLFVGMALAIQAWLNLAGGLEVDLGLAFGTSSLATLVAAAAVFLFLMGRATREAEGIRSSTVPPGEEPKTVPPGLVGAVARARALSEFGRHVDLVLTAPAIVFTLIIMMSFRLDEMKDRTPNLFLIALAVGTLLMCAFFFARPRFSSGTGGKAMLAVLGVVLVAMVSLGLGSHDQITLEGFGKFGGAIAFLGTVTFLGFWARGYFKPEQRRVIAIIWDVLTFFPRRFHPLAVRPYAERAVPELTGRLLHHLDKGRGVILSAHSQGTILGLAALAQIKRADEEDRQGRLARVSYLTYGSPLSQLHHRFFPAYFSPDGFNEIDARLFPDDVTVGEQTYRASWQNFYRETDYIGKRVEVGKPPNLRNTVIPDPPQEPQFQDRSFEPSEDAGPDPARPAWVGLSLHSHYNTDVAVKEWLAALRRALAADGSARNRG